LEFELLSVPAQEATLTNIIVVLADDLGIGDIVPSTPEGKIMTPHLQKMADEGEISFLDAHSSRAVCAHTRYGLLTGR